MQLIKDQLGNPVSIILQLLCLHFFCFMLPDCPACYNLVLDSVSLHRERLAELERLLQDILTNPTVLNDEMFEKTLTTVMVQVEDLWNATQEAARSGGEAEMWEIKLCNMGAINFILYFSSNAKLKITFFFLFEMPKTCGLVCYLAVFCRG